MAERVLTNDAVTYYPNADERRQLMDIRREFEYMRTDPDFLLLQSRFLGVNLCR